MSLKHLSSVLFENGYMTAFIYGITWVARSTINFNELMFDVRPVTDPVDLMTMYLIISVIVMGLQAISLMSANANLDEIHDNAHYYPAIRKRV